MTIARTEPFSRSACVLFALLLALSAVLLPVPALADGHEESPILTTHIEWGDVRVGQASEWQEVRFATSNPPRQYNVNVFPGVEVSGGVFNCDATSCAWHFRFTPSTRGPFSPTFYIGESGVAGYVGVVTSSGRALADAASLTPSSRNFPSTLQGETSDPETFVVRNAGDFPFSVTDVEASGPFEVVEHVCTVQLNPGDTCEIRVRFAPTVAGAQNGQLRVSTSTTGESVAGLSGTGLSDVPAFAVSPEVVHFPQITVGDASAPAVLTVTNTGHVPVAIGETSVSSAFASTVAPECGVIPVDGSCEISVIFTPATGGVTTGELVIPSDGETRQVTLEGEGVYPSLVFEPAAVDFGTVVIDGQEEVTVMVVNEGPGDSVIDSVSIGAPFEVASTDCLGTLSHEESCTFVVRFAPGEAATFEETLRVADQFGNTTFSITGNGVLFDVTPDVTHRDLGSFLAGSDSGPQVVAFTNNGGSDVVVDAVTISGGFEILEETCAGDLSAGALCEVTLRAIAAAGEAGAMTGSLVIEAHANGRHESFSVTLEAFAAVPELFFEPRELDMGKVPAGSNASGVIGTLTNTGNVALNVAIGHSGASALSIRDASCALTPLEPGSTCELIGDYAPTLTAVDEATFTVTASADLTTGVYRIEPVRFTLVGQGVTGAGTGLSESGSAAPAAAIGFGVVMIALGVAFVLRRRRAEPVGSR